MLTVSSVETFPGLMSAKSLTLTWTILSGHLRDGKVALYPVIIGGSDGKEFTCSADLALILGWGRCPRVGNGNPVQYSCLENSKDRGARWAIVHGIARVGHD
ncbi:unnamed protein product [Rangifer tarandus platyrhynchus]|uniref:Uncharacterized protein n=2 Tax=Rangifer tarandus platyrhynchus TaxID=3082113 RepID=A0ABN8XRF3_RANTA|nr:unnamed protein product [Rangifer tarandus platyrhynchus]